jgi:excisionase family DNA binding protein
VPHALRDAHNVPLTVSVKAACELSGLGTRTIWQLLGDGTLESVHVGRRRLVNYESLRRLLEPAPATSHTRVVHDTTEARA